MDSMETRRNAIVEMINENGTVSFAQLKEAFPHVSEMTLRTDLKLLDEARRILRIHGGARSVQVIIGTDDFLNRKSVRNIPQRQHCNLVCKAVSRSVQSDIYHGLKLCHRACRAVASRSNASRREIKPLQPECVRIFGNPGIGAREFSPGLSGGDRLSDGCRFYLRHL